MCPLPKWKSLTRAKKLLGCVKHIIIIELFTANSIEQGYVEIGRENNCTASKSLLNKKFKIDTWY